jgi:hypothetical protein
MTEYNQETLRDFLDRAFAAQEAVDGLIGGLNAGGKMGWWNTNPDGTSLLPEDIGMYWGDGPADILDLAITEIVQEFTETWGRRPTKAELEAGLKFALGTYEEDEP